MRIHRHRATLLAATLLFLLSACGGDGQDPASSSSDPAAETTATSVTTSASATTAVSTAPSDTTPDTASDTSSTTTETTTVAPTGATTITPTTTGTTTLPGEEMVGIGPEAGTILAVFGVAHDDVLNVRAAPGTDQDVVTTLDPLAEDVVALGHTRRLTQSIWFEIEANGVTGWASSRFLHQMGLTDDFTSIVVDKSGGYLEAETMLDLGLMVAETLADPEASTITMAVAPTVGDLGEVTYDLAGLADDATWGYRLHVFGVENEGGEGFVLKSVEATIFCLRAVADDGSCI